MADAPPPAAEHEPHVYCETLESPQGTTCRKPVLSAAAHPQHCSVQILQIGGWMGVIEPAPGATEAYDVSEAPAATPTSRSGPSRPSTTESMGPVEDDERAAAMRPPPLSRAGGARQVVIICIVRARRDLPWRNSRH
jgi:hypothetical protein